MGQPPGEVPHGGILAQGFTVFLTGLYLCALSAPYLRKTENPWCLLLRPLFVALEKAMERNELIEFQPPASTRMPAAESRLSAGRIRNVLVVDPSLELQLIVQDIVRSVATVRGCSTFNEARVRLISDPPELLVTTARLDGHNGLHLVYLASRDPRTRCVVHLTAEDFALAPEVEAAGALVVQDSSLEAAIESLVFGSAAALRGQTEAEN
jgi:hypothetical protein